MTRATAFTAVILLLAAWTPASAQSWEVTGLAGYTPSAGLDNRAPELSKLDLAGGFTWGLQAGWLLTPRWGIEALWTEQASAQTIETSAGSADLFTMTIRQLHGDVVYHLGASTRLRPFVFGGLGATFFSAEAYESETKFSVGLGAGVKYFPWDAIGFRAHFRYLPTMMNDADAADFCDPFGFCQGVLHTVGFAGGVLIRF